MFPTPRASLRPRLPLYPFTLPATRHPTLCPIFAVRTAALTDTTSLSPSPLVSLPLPLDIPVTAAMLCRNRPVSRSRWYSPAGLVTDQEALFVLLGLDVLQVRRRCIHSPGVQRRPDQPTYNLAIFLARNTSHQRSPRLGNRTWAPYHATPFEKRKLSHEPPTEQIAW